MNLQPVKGIHTRIICCVCKEWVSTNEALADLDGPPFQAYYHPRCIQQRACFCGGQASHPVPSTRYPDVINYLCDECFANWHPEVK